ncbi:hypothetical protein CMUS01_11342 [Colletotrichum musicola]|uniref:Peptidase S8/S53 domain-containing protein n=1 Tax=Colletotrichum musicola TaxID=2175873 RepID=A0A8H6N6A8_9PEZI|nr:hypothetical protein CMUS01_11342 [Colletotrichum musicola]
MSATAKEPPIIIKSRPVKEISAKNSKFDDRQSMGMKHGTLAESLFDSGDEKTGLGIFKEYSGRPGNILTSLSLGDASVFHAILEYMKNLVQYAERVDLIRAVPEVPREFLEHLVIKHHKLLTQANADGFRPLDTAAVKLKPIVFLVTDLVLSEDKLRELPARTCRANLKLRPTDVCRFELPSSLRSAFAKEMGGGALAACLHDTVNVDHLERCNAELKDTVKKVLHPPENQKQRGSSGSILHALLDENSFATEGSSIKTESFQRLIGLCSKEALESYDVDRYRPLHKAILLYNTEGIDFDRLHIVIRRLVHQCPSSIYLVSEAYDDTRGQTPYSMLKAVDPRKKPMSGQQHQDKVNSWEQAMKLLKHTCVGDTKRDQDQKLKYLYGGLKNGESTTASSMSIYPFPIPSLYDRRSPLRSVRDDIERWECNLTRFAADLGLLLFLVHCRAQDCWTLTGKAARKIYLDMAFPNMIDKNFVANLANTVQFRLDTALEYVSLRRDLATPQNLCPPVCNSTAQDRNPYHGVFDWLREEFQVEKIFKIIVEDLVPYPHTDQAIRAALKPFGVEKWDWRKLDVCSETIFDAAPETRELYLQSSGNEAVLRSWACKSGLAKLNKTGFRRWRPRTNITLKWAGESASPSHPGGDAASSSSSNQSDQVAWLQTMKPFIDFMDTTIKDAVEEANAHNPAAVTIALIDNGVYSAADDIPTLENGKSWYGQRSKDVPFRDYFTGPSRHGTQMAQCIYKVCPMAQLFVARMDDSKSQVEKFTVDSAIKAIKWATEMGVDIISMSWTFHEKTATDDQKESFKAAIQDASKHGITLLSSLNDREMTMLSEWYPVSLPEVIRVGSATKWGEKAESSKRRSAHYLFPGKDIPLPATADGSGDGDGEVEVVSGSSLATAFAAGLAGLIIYTSRALSCLDGTLSATEIQRLGTANTRVGMERIFKVLGGKPNETQAVDLFVELGSHFSRNPEREAEENGKNQFLRSFLTRLLLLQ